MKTAVHINNTMNELSDTDLGWPLEVAPSWIDSAEYANRSCPPHRGDQWRINFSRVEWLHRIVGNTYQKTPNISEDN